MAYQAQGAIVIGRQQLEQLIARVQSAAREDVHGLLDAIGQQQEDAARRRILETKTAPDGTPWKPWSLSYAKTRSSQHSLLVGEGHLADSITHQIDDADNAVLVGSNLVYARAHLFGTHSIPARPFLDTEPGFADPRDREEIRDIVRDFLEGIL